MNFLAHIYLSKEDKEITIGNFIADAVKGRKYQDYPPEISKGILLHRNIDTFTDFHPTVRKSTARLHANYSHYSGVIVDMLYDHFLAKNWNKYHPEPLASYADNFYKMILENIEIMPERIQKMIPYMVNNNWLESYATIDGMGEILSQMNYRTQGKSNMNLAVNELVLYYPDFQSEFTSFFDELIDFSNQKLKEL